MNRIRLKHILLTAGAIIGLGGCGDSALQVANPNSADASRVLATPNDVETLLGSYYRRFMSGTTGTFTNIGGMAAVQSFENYSTLSNGCMAQRVPVPRPANDNTLGNGCANEQAGVYNRESEVLHVSTQILSQIKGAVTPTPGNAITLGSDAKDQRAIAFGQFLRGLSMGYLALFYDSAAVLSPKDLAGNSAAAGDLKGYKEVMDSAIAAMDQALAATTAGATAFPLPPSWISTPTPPTAAEFAQIIHSYKARLRANNARTPAERAAVDWAAVIADAQAGFTADHILITNTTSGPTYGWLTGGPYQYASWHQMSPFIIGMADTSGAYDSWIKTPLATRGTSGVFTMATPDLRFPQGKDRPAQQADFQQSDPVTGCSTSAAVCKRYYVNRPSDNAAVQAWGASNYDHVRFTAWKISGDAGVAGNGKFPFFTLAELNMLQAEGLIRTGNAAGAAALINITRVKNGLAPIIAPFTTVPFQTGSLKACVPRVPDPAPAQGAASPGTHCGDLMEAMKWEKRVESQYTHFGAWFLDSRGWGDLPQGTGLHWAVPYQDLQVRIHPNYSAGGGLPNSSAALGTYGW